MGFTRLSPTMERWYGLTTALGRAALRGLDITTRVRGEQHLPATGPALLASVHVSYPDFLFIAKAGLQRGRHVRFLCRHDIWHVPVVRRGMDAMRHVPVDRQAPAAAYLRVRSLLADGEVVCAFPEAGISYSYTVRSLMPGVAALSRETGVPIVPVVVWGSQRIASVGRPVDGREPGPGLHPRPDRRRPVRAAAPGRTGRGPDARDPAARRDPHRDAGGGAAAARAPAEDRRVRAVVPRPSRRPRPGPARGAAVRRGPARGGRPTGGPPSPRSGSRRPGGGGRGDPRPACRGVRRVGRELGGICRTVSAGDPWHGPCGPVGACRASRAATGRASPPPVGSAAAPRRTEGRVGGGVWEDQLGRAGRWGDRRRTVGRHRHISGMGLSGGERACGRGRRAMSRSNK